jgi:hypothetical protein
MAAKAIRTGAENLLANVPEEYVFRCCDGNIYRNAQELANAFTAMTEETYAYHANKERNDFSNWVRDIMKDDKLARDLVKAQNKIQARKAILDRIAYLRR